MMLERPLNIPTDFAAHIYDFVIWDCIDPFADFSAG